MTNPTPSTTPSAEEVKQFKRRLFETADRSYVNDRLNVTTLPEHLYGEWIGIDDFSQFHAKQQGFIDGSEYLLEHNKMHQSSIGSSIGDVKFMVIPKWKHTAMQEVTALQSAKKSGLGGDELRDQYNSYAESIGLGITSDEKSSARKITGPEIQAQLKG
jgi:hypothetical protein